MFALEVEREPLEEPRKFPLWGGGCLLCNKKFKKKTWGMCRRNIKVSIKDSGFLKLLRACVEKKYKISHKRYWFFLNLCPRRGVVNKRCLKTMCGNLRGQQHLTQNDQGRKMEIRGKKHGDAKPNG